MHFATSQALPTASSFSTGRTTSSAPGARRRISPAMNVACPADAGNSESPAAGTGSRSLAAATYPPAIHSSGYSRVSSTPTRAP